MSASASSTVSQAKVVKIHEDADVILEVYQITKKHVENKYEETKHPVHLHVNKKALIEIPRLSKDYGTTFKAMFDHARFREADQNIIKLEKDDPKGLELALRLFSAEGVPASFTRTVKVEDLWEFASVCDFRNIDCRGKKAQEWFEKWYEICAENVKKTYMHNNEYLAGYRVLLWPTWFFDHAKGFTEVTKHLAYNAIGHVEALNPTKHHNIQFPNRISYMLNAAKGSLRNKLHTGLFGATKGFKDHDEAGCAHEDKNAMDYERALMRIKVWPIETSMGHSSASTILERLLSYSFTPAEDCKNCWKDYEGTVLGVQAKMSHYFDGLCLDCIRDGVTQSKHLLSECKYGDWEDHRELCGFSDWDSFCRVDHDEPTWFHSTRAKKFRKHRVKQID